jgi:hypothetical protein
MAGTTLDIEEVLSPDQMGCAIANKYMEWDTLKAPTKTAWEEIQRYIYSKDTSTTSNGKLPWKNKTTLPKLCQIRDNLYANYVASLFPKSHFIEWQGARQDEQTKAKSEVMESYTEYWVNQPCNREVLYKLVLDYIDYGNAFAMVDWRDGTVETETEYVTGYIGPQIVRISPYDIVLNPTAPSFDESPKIVRSIVTIGELVKKLDSPSFTDDIAETQKAFDYIKDLRVRTNQHTGGFTNRNALYAVDGFTSFELYLNSNYVELLTFYGDYYDVNAGRMYRNAVITVADRHKILGVREGVRTKVRHIGWRPRQDNVWAMGPLENLVGMQYRVDHIENLKADVFDLIAAPPLMVKGLVEDFEWAPFARIMVGDDGDIKPLAPDGNVLQANLEIDQLQAKMEEYAGSPKEAAGFRTPGEKTAFEVQRLENAANRIFYTKTKQFEELFEEHLMNDALKEGQKRADSRFYIRIFNDDLNVQVFKTISGTDLAGLGRIRPVAARNFADKAEKVQNVNNFFGSVLGQDPEIKAHFSSIALARMFEELLDLEPYEIVKPYIRLIEGQEAQQLANAGAENTAMQAMAPAGMAPDDVTQ